MGETDGDGWRANRAGPWAAVDAGLLRNPKVEQLARPAARLLYVAGVLHCADELTDGFIAAASLPRLLLAACARRPDAVELERVGLWIPRGNPQESHQNLARNRGGWDVSGYLEWNPPRSWWEQQRTANARRQAEWRERQRQHAQQRDAGSNALRNGLVIGERDETRVRSSTRTPSRTPPICPLCAVALPRSTSLVDHLRVVHDVQEPDLASGR